MTRVTIIIPQLLICIFLLSACGGPSNNADGNTDRSDIFPRSVGWVNDFEEIFTDDQVLALTDLIIRLEKEKHVEVSIVTVNSIEPYTDVLDYTTELGNYWGLKENGMIIVLSKNQRLLGTGTGAYVERVFPFTRSQAVIDSVMVPELKEDRYFEAIRKGVEAINTELPAETRSQPDAK